jgi:ribose/xylose/arabinose/galactoside ABC-type transport system permease subunit
MIMGPWLVWVFVAFAIIAGLILGFTVKGFVCLLSGLSKPLARNRGWMVLPVCAVFFVWLPLVYHLPMSYVPYGFLGAVVASIIILY